MRALVTAEKWLGQVRTRLGAGGAALRSIGMIASANLVATALGLVGSLVQARFIAPTDLGFIRKYSVVSNYAIFLSLGLFTIVQREYAVQVGRGDERAARRAVAIGQSWIVLVSTLVCSGLLLVAGAQLLLGNAREAAGWLVQVVAVGSLLYGGHLASTFRSGQDFISLSKSSYVGAALGVLVLPLFALWPFPALVIRSIAGPVATTLYQHLRRPVRVAWHLPLGEWRQLVGRGMRLFVGSYLRYNFWVSVEVWAVLALAGDGGIGLFVFASTIAAALGQLATAVNQVFAPRMAVAYGKTGDVTECLRLAARPTLVNVAAGLAVAAVALLLLPTLVSVAFPRYGAAVPILKILLLEIPLVAASLPLYMVAVLEDHRVQTLAAVAGLATFAGLTYALGSHGGREVAVAWGTMAGKTVFVLVQAMSLRYRVRIGALGGRVDRSP